MVKLFHSFQSQNRSLLNPREKIEAFLTQGRFQHALEQARQLYKHEAMVENRELLRQATLGRAEQLQSQGKLRDVCSLLENAVPLGADSPSFLERIAVLMSACGNAQRGLALLRTLPESATGDEVLALAVDHAM